MIVYEYAPNGIQKRVKRIMLEYHKWILDMDIPYRVLISEGDKSPRIAFVASLNGVNGFYSQAKFHIAVSKEKWAELNSEQKEFVIDHELTHLRLRMKKGGEVATDHEGLPRIMIRRHDIEDFTEVIKRRGINVMEGNKTFFKEIKKLSNKGRKKKGAVELAKSTK